MMLKYFSPAENAFYAPELKEIYLAAGSWPADAVKVDDDMYLSFIAEPPDGKYRGVNNAGMPCWVDFPPPTTEDIIARTEETKQQLIDKANTYINSRQWPGKAAIGRLKDNELIHYGLWLDYLDALEAVDSSSTGEINWPVPPEL